MTLEQAKRMYKTWKRHPDMIIDGEQATEVIDEYIKLLKQLEELYKQNKKESK